MGWVKKDNILGPPGTTLHSELTDVSADDHHDKVHDMSAGDHTSFGQDAGKVVEADGLGGTQWATPDPGVIDHGLLTNVQPDQHHAKYTDAEAVDAVDVGDKFVKNTGDSMTGALTLPWSPSLPLEAAPKQYVDATVVDHTAIVDAHHARYTDQEAIDATPPGLDHYVQVAAPANPLVGTVWVNPDDPPEAMYLPLSGGTMAGPIDMGGQNIGGVINVAGHADSGIAIRPASTRSAAIYDGVGTLRVIVHAGAATLLYDQAGTQMVRVTTNAVDIDGTLSTNATIEAYQDISIHANKHLNFINGETNYIQVEESGDLNMIWVHRGVIRMAFTVSSTWFRDSNNVTRMEVHTSGVNLYGDVSSANRINAHDGVTLAGGDLTFGAHKIKSMFAMGESSGNADLLFDGSVAPGHASSSPPGLGGIFSVRNAVSRAFQIHASKNSGALSARGIITNGPEWTAAWWRASGSTAVNQTALIARLATVAPSTVSTPAAVVDDLTGQPFVDDQVDMALVIEHLLDRIEALENP